MRKSVLFKDVFFLKKKVITKEQKRKRKNVESKMQLKEKPRENVPLVSIRPKKDKLIFPWTNWCSWMNTRSRQVCFHLQVENVSALVFSLADWPEKKEPVFRKKKNFNIPYLPFHDFTDHHNFVRHSLVSCLGPHKRIMFTNILPPQMEHFLENSFEKYPHFSFFFSHVTLVKKVLIFLKAIFGHQYLREFLSYENIKGMENI